MDGNTIKLYKAWDLPTRLFHWVNVLCILLLSILGLIMLNKAAMGISGTEASVGLKTTHVLVGYVFSLNLVIRFVLGFVGGHHSRWTTLFPGKDFKNELHAYQDSVKSGRPLTFIGHNPKGRLSVLVMLLLMTMMMATGLIRAATDIYYPPFGHLAAAYVAAQDTPPGDLKPYDETGTNPEKMAQLQAFKRPVGTIHLYGAYLFWLLIIVHITVVVRSENAGNGSLVSAMISGRKYLPREPVDS